LTWRYGRCGRGRPSLRGLTDREQEVGIQVARGLSIAEIAQQLNLSEATVKAHVSRLLTKLEVTNGVQLAITVRDAGLA